jgi:hypothetical protein
MYKLLMRAFPNWFRGNSVYAMFPFTVPEANREILRGFGKEQDFSYDKPSFIPQPQVITTWEGVKSVLEDQATFKVPCKFSFFSVVMGANVNVRGTSHSLPDRPRLHAKWRLPRQRRAEEIRQ